MVTRWGGREGKGREGKKGKEAMKERKRKEKKSEWNWKVHVTHSFSITSPCSTQHTAGSEYSTVTSFLHALFCWRHHAHAILGQIYFLLVTELYWQGNLFIQLKPSYVFMMWSFDFLYMKLDLFFIYYRFIFFFSDLNVLVLRNEALNSW